MDMSELSRKTEFLTVYRISRDIYPQMNILNRIIPILSKKKGKDQELMYFCT